MINTILTKYSILSVANRNSTSYRLLVIYRSPMIEELNGEYIYIPVCMVLTVDIYSVHCLGWVITKYETEYLKNLNDYQFSIKCLSSKMYGSGGYFMHRIFILFDSQ